MKKNLFFLSIVSILFFCSCDLVRKLAGMPDSKELIIKEKLIEARKKEIQDSIVAAKLAREIEIRDSIAREVRLRDSLARADSLASLRFNLSDRFSYGVPVNPLTCRYNLIVGVYRQKSEADKLYRRLVRKSYQPQYILFPGGEHAVCLCSSDDPAEVERILKKAIAARDCPKDSWVYLNR